MCGAVCDSGAVLEVGNAPSWIAAYAAMTKGVSASIAVTPVQTGVYAPTAVLWA